MNFELPLATDFDSSTCLTIEVKFDLFFFHSFCMIMSFPFCPGDLLLNMGYCYKLTLYWEGSNRILFVNNDETLLWGPDSGVHGVLPSLLLSFCFFVLIFFRLKVVYELYRFWLGPLWSSEMITHTYTYTNTQQSISKRPKHNTELRLTERARSNYFAVWTRMLQAWGVPAVWWFQGHMLISAVQLWMADISGWRRPRHKAHGLDCQDIKGTEPL